MLANIIKFSAWRRNQGEKCWKLMFISCLTVEPVAVSPSFWAKIETLKSFCVDVSTSSLIEKLTRGGSDTSGQKVAAEAADWLLSAPRWRD